MTTHCTGRTTDDSSFYMNDMVTINKNKTTTMAVASGVGVGLSGQSNNGLKRRGNNNSSSSSSGSKGWFRFCAFLLIAIGVLVHVMQQPAFVDEELEKRINGNDDNENDNDNDNNNSRHVRSKKTKKHHLDIGRTERKKPMLIEDRHHELPSRVTTTTTTTKKEKVKQDAKQESEAAAAEVVMSQTSGSSDKTVVEPPRPPLEFVHIPKTGGSSIEAAAADGDGISWGACHYSIKAEKNTLCPKHHRFFIYRTSYLQSLPKESSPWPAFWHVPPSYMRQEQMLQSLPDFFTNATIPYPNHIPLFAVVRNPYERVLSDWYFEMKVNRGKSSNYTNRASLMNAFLNTTLQQVKTATRPTDPSDMRVSHPYWIHQGHYIPQYDYIYDTTTTTTTTSTSNPVQLVQHVLKFENLTAEYADLMAQYGLKNRLPEERVNANSNKLLSVQNMTRSNIQLIHEIYERDFESFGYEKLTQY